ncbi:MAG TPA: AtpZ/AtpI family protein [Patescibacteria group bacterium]|nr:AtpZ/AtpI family protein [Patescibacteria group bacterium]
MKKAAAHPTTKPLSGSTGFTAGDIALQFLDTTWRMGVPVVTLSMLGLIGDRTFGTKPWLTLLGAALGFTVAIWLIKRLLADVLRKENS